MITSYHLIIKIGFSALLITILHLEYLCISPGKPEAIQASHLILLCFSFYIHAVAVILISHRDLIGDSPYLL